MCILSQGYNVTIGPGCYINFNCCFLDCAKITIGKNVREKSSPRLCSSRRNDLKARCAVLQVLIQVLIPDLQQQDHSQSSRCKSQGV